MPWWITDERESYAPFSRLERMRVLYWNYYRLHQSMKHTKLMRDIAKVGVGLAIADMASVLWLGTAGFFPLTVLGVTWTADSIMPIAVFDLALVVVLAHYAWHTKMPATPSERSILRIAGVIFLVVAALHLSRIAFGWPLVLGNFEAPVWLSWFGVAAAAYLSYASFHFAHRLHR